MSRPLLAIDAGNSRWKFGLFVPSHSSFYRRNPDGTSVIKIAEAEGAFPTCRRFLAIPAGDPIPWSTLTDWHPEGTVIAGSNPSAIDRVLAEWPHSDICSPLVVRDRNLIPVKIDVETPEKVGIDRLLSAVAANALRPASRAAIVIDSGTATTVNYVSRDGLFCGGAILPGLEMSAKALHRYTAVLPLLPVNELGGEPPVAPGRNTREAIRNGLFWGQVGAIRELVRQHCIRNGLREPDFDAGCDLIDCPWLVMTGGGAPVLQSQFPGILSLPSLGMHGLVLTAWLQGA